MTATKGSTGSVFSQDGTASTSKGVSKKLAVLTSGGDSAGSELTLLSKDRRGKKSKEKKRKRDFIEDGTPQQSWKKGRKLILNLHHLLQ